MGTRETYIENLRKSNFKITPQRIEVIKFLEQGGFEHFTAEDVYNSVRSREPTITLATVYNILRALREAGNINSFEARGKTWFETNMDFHGNLVCDSCGKIIDVPVDPQRFSDIPDTSGYSVKSASLVIRGLCRECNRSEVA